MPGVDAVSDETLRALITQTAPILGGIAAVLLALRRQTIVLRADVAEVKKGVNGQTDLLLRATRAEAGAAGHEAGRAEATAEARETAATLAEATRGGGNA